MEKNENEAALKQKADVAYVAESDSSQLLAKTSSTTGGIQKVEQTAPLQDGPAAWASDF